VQKPHPPIWLAARGPKSIGRAARNGYHFMGTGGVDQQQMYDAALTEHGRRPQDYNIAQLRTVFVASRHDKAWDDAEAGAHYMMSCYGKWFVEANDLPGDQAYGADIPPIGKLRNSETAALFGESLMIGTPDEAIAGIEDYTSRTRVTHLVAAMALPGIDPRKVHRSMELFAKEVMPHFWRKARKQAKK
jgi:alkanesulfonate monooxygenase SsuD/methylene tetrahydromethanopterin reductase-like flavin-dependent oxidoreductase (luciferase family)